MVLGTGMKTTTNYIILKLRGIRQKPGVGMHSGCPWGSEKTE